MASEGNLGGPPCAACTQPCCKLGTGHGWGALPMPTKDDGTCVNLSDDGKCMDYENRPQACRNFDCRERKEAPWPEFVAALIGEKK